MAARVSKWWSGARFIGVARVAVGCVSNRTCQCCLASCVVDVSYRNDSVGRVVRVTTMAVWHVRSHSCHPENGLKSGGFVHLLRSLVPDGIHCKLWIAFRDVSAVVGLSASWALVFAAGRRVRVEKREW